VVWQHIVLKHVVLSAGRSTSRPDHRYARWLDRKIVFELITELLEFERSIYWRTGQRLKCHSGRYRSVGRIFARIALALFLRNVERVVTAHSERLFYERTSVQ
jgi:hypothetical protein